MATIFIRRRPDSVMEWEIEDVLDWLKELRLERFCKRFKNHLITGPILLQMDDLLLDDLQIDSNTEREILLTESRRLCLQELKLVDTALQYKQKFEEIPKSSTNGSKRLDFKSCGSQPHMSTKRTVDVNANCNQAAVRQECSNEADKVAARATLMVTILSQENSSLRAQLQKSSNCKDQCIKMLQQEISQLKSENHHLRSKVHTLEIEFQRVLNELQEKGGKCEKIENYKDIILNLKQENLFLRDKFQVFKCKTIEREVMRSFSRGIKNTNSCSLQSSLAKDCPSNKKQEESELHLINKVYSANKRCAELEDTIRWLYAEVLLAENNNKTLEYQVSGFNDEAEEEQAPSEPEWPSLIGCSPTNESSVETESDEHALVVNRLITGQGLPTDTDEDIWRLKGFGSSDELLFQKWNV